MQHLCLLLIILLPLSLSAEELKIHGFVAQGVIQAEHSNFVEDDGELSFKLTEVGLNASYKINNQLRLAGQGIYLNGGNRYPEGLRVDYLFVEWQFLSNADWQLKMQLGRNKNYHWLYSSTRDVPHTRPSIVLPQSMYFDALRDFALGVDGLVVIANTQNDWGDWDFNFSYGSIPVSTKQKNNLVGMSALGDLNHDNDKQVSVYWRPQESQWQLGISIVGVEFSYHPAQSDFFYYGKNKTERLNLHFLYQGEKWEFASELVREKTEMNGLFAPLYHNKVTSEGGYIQSRYFLNSDVTLMSRLDIYDRNRKDRSGKELEMSSSGLFPRYFGFMDQATFGVTWKLFKNTQIQGEYHKVKGTGHLAPYLLPNTVSNDRKYWDMWAIQLMYWF